MTSLQTIPLLLWISTYLTCTQSAEYNYFINSDGIAPHTSTLWLLPTIFNGTYYYRGCIPSANSNSNWNIAEWSFPNELPLHALFPNDTKSTPCVYPHTSPSSPLLWWTQSANGIVCMYGNDSASGIESNQIELHIIGTTDLQCGIEMDLFAQPNQPPWSGYPMGFIGTGAEYPYLAQMDSLTLQFSMQMIAEPNVTFSCGTSFCGEYKDGSWHLDYGYSTVGVILNTATQTIFYQIMMQDTRQNYDCSAASNVCSEYQYWYFENNPFGVSDTIAVFGYECLQYPETAVLEFDKDILQRLKDTITGNVNGVAVPKGLDQDLSHWQVSGFYIGVGVQGVVQLDYVVRDISLIASY